MPLALGWGGPGGRGPPPGWAQPPPSRGTGILSKTQRSGPCRLTQPRGTCQKTLKARATQGPGQTRRVWGPVSRGRCGKTSSNSAEAAPALLPQRRATGRTSAGRAGRSWAAWIPHLEGRRGCWTEGQTDAPSPASGAAPRPCGRMRPVSGLGSEEEADGGAGGPPEAPGLEGVRPEGGTPEAPPGRRGVLCGTLTLSRAMRGRKQPGSDSPTSAQGPGSGGRGRAHAPPPLLPCSDPPARPRPASNKDKTLASGGEWRWADSLCAPGGPPMLHGPMTMCPILALVGVTWAPLSR